MASVTIVETASIPTRIEAGELIEGPTTNGNKGLQAPFSPNKGSSLSDWQAIGSNAVAKTEWLKSRAVDPSQRVKITKLSHMRYQHPDLPQISGFLADFGLHIVKQTDTERWYRGYGPDNYVYYARHGPKAFLGGVFEVENEQELKKVLNIPNVQVLTTDVEDMSGAPGGGRIVTIQDPEGFPVSFICGQSPTQQSHHLPEKLLLNDESHKPRQRKFQRFVPGPAEVYKLGHFGMVVEKFPDLLDWYTRYFNIVPSDVLYLPVQDAEGNTVRKEVAMFAHIDRGVDLVDHHSLFLSSAAPGKKHHVHHCSFEIHDYDTQALGHQWLAQKGYPSVWGVGRHILGSQIFDYWWDTTGNMVEHYADGDLVNMETPMAFGPAGHEGLAVWGPEVPKAFLD